MKTLPYTLTIISAIQICTAQVIIDDFAETNLSGPITANSTSTTSGSGVDPASTTLFASRVFTVSIDNRPVDARSLAAEIGSGRISISTSSSDTSGDFLLYHDSDFGGPYLDLSSYQLENSEIQISFYEPPTADLGVTIALQATDGRLIYRPTISAGTSTFKLFLDSYSAMESTLGAMSTIYETRWFFDIPAGASFSIESISIVPEPRPLFYFVLLASCLMVHKYRLTRRCSQPLAASLLGVGERSDCR